VRMTITAWLRLSFAISPRPRELPFQEDGCTVLSGEGMQPSLAIGLVMLGIGLGSLLTRIAMKGQIDRYLRSRD
jgi:hypothetical protein